MKTKLTYIKFITLCLGIFVYCNSAFAGVLSSSNSAKSDLGTITAHAYFDGGIAEYAGYSSGKICIWNTKGCHKLKNLPCSGKIDSIVNTAGNKNWGDFTFIEDGKVYTCYIDKSKYVNLRFPEDAKFLDYDAEYGLFCSTSSGFVYCLKNYSGNGIWEKISDKNIENKHITYFKHLSSGLYIATNNNGTGEIYRYGAEKWNFIKSLNANINKIIPDAHYQNNINVSAADGNFYSINTDDKNINKVRSNMINNTADHNNSITLASKNLKNSDNSVKPQNMNVSIQYVSEADMHPNEAVYKITIRGRGINEHQLFDLNHCNDSKEDISKGYKTGYNGFWYTLSCNGTESKEYPLSGMRFISDSLAYSACLNPRTISFFWKGPKCTKEGEYKLRIETHVYKIKSDKNNDIVSETPAGLHTSVIDLPPADSWQPSDNLTLEVTGNSNFSTTNNPLCNNGVCAAHFNVIIRDNGNILPSDDEEYPAPKDNPYNHLVFYGSDIDGIQPDKLIDCNPFNSNNYYLAIESQEGVELDNKEIKYGTFDKENDTAQDGRVFYLFAGKNQINGTKITAALIWDENQIPVPSPACKTFDVNTEQLGIDCSSNDSQNFYLKWYNKEDKIKVSSWEGYNCKYSDNINAGYLDYTYVPDDSNDFNILPAIYAVFPQGENPLNIDNRLNPADMQVGFYANPVADSTPDGLTAKSYFIYANPSYCDKLRNKQLYAYLFDCYGRYCRKQFPAADTMKKFWDTGTFIKVRLANWSNVPICMFSDRYHIIGIPWKGKGIFFPPATKHDEANNGIDFLSIYNTKVESTDESAHVYGTKMCNCTNPDDLKNNFSYFRAHLAFTDNDSPFGHLYMHDWVNITLPKDGHIMNAYDNGYEDHLFLPLNQLKLQDTSGAYGHVYQWGVYFIPWDLSYTGGTTKTREKHYNDDKNFRIFAQNVDFYTDGETTKYRSNLPATKAYTGGVSVLNFHLHGH